MNKIAMIFFTLITERRVIGDNITDTLSAHSCKKSAVFPFPDKSFSIEFHCQSEKYYGQPNVFSSDDFVTHLGYGSEDNKEIFGRFSFKNKSFC